MKLVNLAASTTNSSYDFFALFYFIITNWILLAGGCNYHNGSGYGTELCCQIPESQLTKSSVTVHCCHGKESKVDTRGSFTLKCFAY